MKIFGVGADIVKIKRIKKSLKKAFIKDYLIRKIFKCSKIKNSANCFVKRFAAKEAFSKALGTGISRYKIQWNSRI